MAVNEVRQVLMNEMGLTRESVRAETLEVVEKTAEKFLNSLLESGQLGRILVRAANEELQKSGRWAKTLAGYVEDGAKAAARDWIDKNVEIRRSKA